MSYTEVKIHQATFRILHRYEGKGILRPDLPRDFAAVLVEMVHTKPIADPDRRAEAFISGLQEIKDFSLLVERVKENKARVYFGDLAESEAIASSRDLDLMALELTTGLVMLGRGMRFLFPGSKKNRKKRYALKGIALLFTSLWFLSSSFEVLGFFLVNVAGNTGKKGFLKAIRETIGKASNLHPEKMVVFLRNLVLAEKAWEIASLEGKRVEKPLIVLDLHFGHAGIGKMLKWPVGLRVFLLKLYRPFIKAILADRVQRDYFTRLISVYWNKGSWQQERNYEVDSLEEI
jgi:hypothetical protein